MIIEYGFNYGNGYVFGWINLDINNEIGLDLKWILKMGIGYWFG